MFVVFFGELCNFLVPNYSDPYRKKNVNRMEMDGILQEKYKIKPPSILSMFQPYYLRSADPYLRASSLKLKCELPTFLFLEKGQLDSASEVQSFSLQEPNIHVRVIYFMLQHSWFVFFFSWIQTLFQHSTPISPFREGWKPLESLGTSKSVCRNCCQVLRDSLALDSGGCPAACLTFSRSERDGLS